MSYKAALFILTLAFLVTTVLVVMIMAGHLGCNPGPRPIGYSPAQWAKVAQSMCN